MHTKLDYTAPNSTLLWIIPELKFYTRNKWLIGLVELNEERKSEKIHRRYLTLWEEGGEGRKGDIIWSNWKQQKEIMRASTDCTKLLKTLLSGHFEKPAEGKDDTVIC